MDQVLGIKEQGTLKFKAGELFEAKCLYSGALELLEKGCMHLQEADAVWLGLKNNMALCDLKREEWTRVVETTTEVLTRDAQNTKALYRRGLAHIGSSKLQAARRDLETALEIEPNNAEVRQKLCEIARRTRAEREADKGQAGSKLRGFLNAERLDDGVTIGEDGGVRKLHCNEQSVALASWIKPEWLTKDSGVAAAVTAHVVIKEQAGKELYSSRRPAVAAGQPAQASAASTTPPAPCRWVLNDSRDLVFAAWNTAAKASPLKEVAKYEVAARTLGPSVEEAIQRCMDRWLPENAVNDGAEALSRRRQAIQVLSLPEALCLQQPEDPDASFATELEVLEAAEFHDVHGDGRILLRVLQGGRHDEDGAAKVTDLATVTAHYRVATLMTNRCLNDSRMGLVLGEKGLVMKEDPSKEPADFVVGEEDVGLEGEFVPPCIGRCLLSLPEGVVEGTHLELILREGLPACDMDRGLHEACKDGVPEVVSGTTGPVAVRVEVQKIRPPLQGPGLPGWQGLASLRRERERAEQLEASAGARCRQGALKRWRRVAAWLTQMLRGRAWQLESADAGGKGTMYELEWGDEDEGVLARPLHETPEWDVAVEDELLRLLSPDELSEWAAAHAAVARLLRAEGDMELLQRHARCVLQAASVGDVPKELQVGARSALGASLLDAGDAEQALKVLKAALDLEPGNKDLKDQCALAAQKVGDAKTAGMADELKRAKEDLAAALEADDISRLLQLLERVDDMPLTWEVASASAIGKEVGRCAKHSDGAVVDRARAIVGKLHRLAKAERPMWTR